MEKVLPQQRGNFFVSNAPVFGSLWFALKGSQERLPLLLQKKPLLFSNLCSIITFERTFSLGSD